MIYSDKNVVKVKAKEQERKKQKPSYFGSYKNRLIKIGGYCKFEVPKATG